MEIDIQKDNDNEVFNWLNEPPPIQLDTTNQQSQTPMMIACKYRALKSLKRMLEKNPPKNVINAVDSSGRTALHYACSVKATMQKDTRESLNLEAWDHLEIVKHLLEREANIEAQDQLGLTPLHCASYIGHLEIVKHLLERGANTSTLGIKKWSARNCQASVGKRSQH